MKDRVPAWVAQLVERVLGKDEVTGSIPVPGSRIFRVPRGTRARGRGFLYALRSSAELREELLGFTES